MGGVRETSMGVLVYSACVLVGILAGIFGTNLLHLILTATVFIFIGVTEIIYRNRGLEAMLIFVAISWGLCVLVPMWLIVVCASVAAPPNWMLAVWHALIR